MVLLFCCLFSTRWCSFCTCICICIGISSSFFSRRITGNEVLKHFPVHEPALLDRSSIIAGKQKSKEIFKIPGNRMNILSGTVRRTYREDHFLKAFCRAKVNTVHACPADDLGKYGRAEIPALLLSSLETNM